MSLKRYPHNPESYIVKIRSDKGKILREISIIRGDLKKQQEELTYIQTSFTRLLNIFNERITDLYGEIDHIKKYGGEASSTQRERKIMHNYFADGR